MLEKGLRLKKDAQSKISVKISSLGARDEALYGDAFWSTDSN